MKSKLVSLTGLAILAAGTPSQAQMANSNICAADTNETLSSLFSNAYMADEELSVENFIPQLTSALQAKCDSKLISKADLAAIVNVAESINELYPDLHTSTDRSNALSITTYVQFGLKHTTNGLCASDIGSSSAVFDCVCTQIQLNELKDHSQYTGVSQCR